MGIAAASVATASSAAVVVVATSLAAKKDICAISLVHSDGATCELSSAASQCGIAPRRDDRRQCTKEKEGASEMKTGRNRSRNVWSQQL